jgi:hypothetical protein
VRIGKKRLQHLRQLSEQLSFTQINNAIIHLSSSIWLVHPQPYISTCLSKQDVPYQLLFYICFKYKYARLGKHILS